MPNPNSGARLSPAVSTSHSQDTFDPDRARLVIGSLVESLGGLLDRLLAEELRAEPILCSAKYLQEKFEAAKPLLGSINAMITAEGRIDAIGSPTGADLLVEHAHRTLFELCWCCEPEAAEPPETCGYDYEAVSPARLLLNLKQSGRSRAEFRESRRDLDFIRDCVLSDVDRVERLLREVDHGSPTWRFEGMRFVYRDRTLEFLSCQRRLFLLLQTMMEVWPNGRLPAAEVRKRVKQRTRKAGQRRASDLAKVLGNYARELNVILGRLEKFPWSVQIERESERSPYLCWERRP